MNETKLHDAIDLCREALAGQPGFDERERAHWLAVSRRVHEVLDSRPVECRFPFCASTHPCSASG